MRKLIFQEFLSLDGYAADKDDSTKFFERPEYSEESDDDLLQEKDRFGTILLGANTIKCLWSSGLKPIRKNRLLPTN
jgi:hypothetical protein